MDVKQCVNSLFDQWLGSLPSSPWALWEDTRSFTVPHNWEERPMIAWVAWAVLAVNVATWWFYYYERAVIRRKYKKFIATRMTGVLLVHVLSGVAETITGFISVLQPQDARYAHLTAYLALFLHIPSNLVLSPRVWGLRYITVTGYVVVGLLRAVTALRVLLDTHFLVADLWILLQMATLVRIIVYFVTPWSSADGHPGDLSTEAFTHTLAIGTASLVTTAFVQPPWVLLAVLALLALMRRLFPPRISFTSSNYVKVLDM